MNPTQLKIEKQFFTARQRDRRRLPGSGKWLVIVLAIAILSSLFTWKWRYVLYAPQWAVRALWADHTDLYLGKTNGIPNLQIVQQARNYLTQMDQVDPSGNFTMPETLRPLDIRLKAAWFQRHHPDNLDYNPFLSQTHGNFIVSWLYVPGCERMVWKPSKSDTDWYDVQGQPCYAVCAVSVLMAPNLRLTTIKLDSPR